MPMPPSSPYPIVLTPDERAALHALARRPTTAYRLVVRPRIVLAAADGVTNTAIATRYRVHVDTVRKWRVRFYQLDEATRANLRDLGENETAVEVPADVIAGIAARTI
jgi:ABC-type phosphate/phosphonate transport system substrate-binding protein